MDRAVFRKTSFLIAAILFVIFACANLIQASPEDTAFVEAKLKDFLRSKDSLKLKPLLAENSRIFLSFEKIKDAKGFFSSDQTILIFSEFFAGTASLDFNMESTGGEPGSPLFTRISLSFQDKSSKICTSEITFTFIKENGKWRIKEIREASP